MVPKRIDSITTMEDLQMYACSKVRNTKDWAMKCVDCGKCPVGKKAEELLEKETAPEVTPVKETAYTRIEEALKHENPEQWLVDKGYYCRKKSAHEAIRRYRHGLLSNNGYAKKPVGLGKGPQAMSDKTRQTVVDIFDSAKTFEEAVANYLSKQDPDRRIGSTFSKLYSWKQNYPDLDKKYPFLAETAKYLTRKEFKDMSVADLIKKLSSSEEDDEVSVDDFLQENDDAKPEVFVCGDVTVTADGSVVKTEDLVKAAEDFKLTRGEKLDKAATDAHIELKPTESQEVIRDEFSKKRRELHGKLSQIKRKMDELTAEADIVRAQLEMLDSVALMFNLAPVKKVESA